MTSADAAGAFCREHPVMSGTVGEDLHEVHGPNGDQTGQIRKPGPGEFILKVDCVTRARYLWLFVQIFRQNADVLFY